MMLFGDRVITEKCLNLSMTRLVSHDINHELDRQNIREYLCATPAMFGRGNSRETVQPRRGAMDGPRR
jgi:hypothetical protein